MEMSSPAAKKAMLRGVLWAVLLIAAAGAGHMRFIAAPWREIARAESCQSNLRILQNAALMYMGDWDERMPPRPAADGDYVAFHWSAMPMEVGLRHGYHITAPQGGPLRDYVKNDCVSRCPSDPDNKVNTYAAGAHSSYVWNYAIAGKLIKDAADAPLAWDRAPFHKHGRNLVWITTWGKTGRKAAWMSEPDFQALVNAPSNAATSGPTPSVRAGAVR